MFYLSNFGKQCKAARNASKFCLEKEVIASVFHDFVLKRPVILFEDADVLRGGFCRLNTPALTIV